MIHDTQVFQEGFHRRRTRDEEAQGRHLEERSLRQDGQEPQAGDRDRIVRGACQGKEGAEEGRREAKDVEEAEDEEVTIDVIASGAKQTTAPRNEAWIASSLRSSQRRLEPCYPALRAR